LARAAGLCGSCSLRRAARDGQAAAGSQSKQTFASLFNSANRRATILASVPWFLQDLGTYGIGIFTPTILAAAVGTNEDHARSIADLIAKDVTAAKGAALITTLLIVGCQPRSR
jgi:putative MFS transporter